MHQEFNKSWYKIGLYLRILASYKHDAHAGFF